MPHLLSQSPPSGGGCYWSWSWSSSVVAQDSLLPGASSPWFAGHCSTLTCSVAIFDTLSVVWYNQGERYGVRSHRPQGDEWVRRGGRAPASGTRTPVGLVKHPASHNWQPVYYPSRGCLTAPGPAHLGTERAMHASLLRGTATPPCRNRFPASGQRAGGGGGGNADHSSLRRRCKPSRTGVRLPPSPPDCGKPISRGSHREAWEGQAVPCGG